MLVHLTIKGECDDLKCFEGRKRVRKIEKECMGSYKSCYISEMADYRKIIREGDTVEGENVRK